MTWTIETDAGEYTSDASGLSSRIMPLVLEWLNDRANMIEADPYPSAVEFDPNDETMVLSAHVQMLQELPLTILSITSTVPERVDRGMESPSKRLRF